MTGFSSEHGRDASSSSGEVRRVFRSQTESSPAFELAYVRTGPRTSTPTVVIPGGPGLASLLPYRSLRRLASRGGLDLIMIEHRGVGSSRNDVNGQPLPFSAMHITDVLDDIAAVLDREKAETAFIAGSSYGSYLASAFGVRHPERVAGMLLDSALQSTHDIEIERALIRQLFWHADSEVANAVRELSERGEHDHLLLDVVRAAYELGGDRLLLPVLKNRLHTHISPTWFALEAYAARDESIVRVPGFYEFDIAGAIGFRELNYGAAPDGHALDPALTYAKIAGRFPSFTGEPYDLPSLAGQFTWPLVALSGTRDIRTPTAVAERVVESAHDAVLVQIENGHSALDTHPAAFLNAVRQLVAGNHLLLPGMARRLTQLPARGLSARLPTFLRAASRIESLFQP